MFSVGVSRLYGRFFAFVLGTSCLGILGFGSSTFAVDRQPVAIRQVQVLDQDRVELVLDGRIDSSQIRTEFINDIIQLSVSDATVYPAKISSVAGRDLTKIFVYQYAPKLVRVRLTVKGKAEAFQNRIQVRPNGKTVSIRLDGGKPAVEKSAANSGEQALLEKVLQSTSDSKPEKTGAQVQEPKTSAPIATDLPSSRNSKRMSDNSRMETLGGKKDVTSPWKGMLALSAILAGFGLVAVAFRKFALARGKGGALSRWVRKSLGARDQMIEVMATHHLGPKKSIHMVRVGGRTLVLGVSDDSINLISEMSTVDMTAGTGATARDYSHPAAAEAATVAPNGDSDFFSELGEQLARESASAPSPVRAPEVRAASRISTRDRIRSRLEGMKQL